MSNIANSYNQSPFGIQSGHVQLVNDFIQWLRGMNGDCAALVKKDFRLMGEWKSDIKFYDLGEDVMLSQLAKEMVESLWKMEEKKIAEAGGKEAWDALSGAEQLQTDVNMMNALI